MDVCLFETLKFMLNRYATATIAATHTHIQNYQSTFAILVLFAKKQQIVMNNMTQI